MMKVAVIMGSDSDFSVMSRCVDRLETFGVPCEVRVLSAHRSPDETARFIKSAKKNGFGVIIAAAGGAAHLAGAAAANTTLPIIGVPVSSTTLAGFDALLATVQMPPGIPVATVAVGEYGAINAALLAVQILALSDEALAKKFADFKEEQRKSVANKNKAVQKLIDRNRGPRPS